MEGRQGAIDGPTSIVAQADRGLTRLGGFSDALAPRASGELSLNVQFLLERENPAARLSHPVSSHLESRCEP